MKKSTLNEELVLTKPDNTQSRLMTIMNEKNWDHFRVFNLSDLREKDSKKLRGLIKGFKEKTRSDLHSIFSKDRYKNMCNKFGGNTTPIIFAWGTLNVTKEYAKECISLHRDRKIIGIGSVQSNLYFQHPLTTKISWKSEIMELIKKNNL